ncbi:hypothetical protein ACWCSD_38920 [Nonomuraea sp. NPDC001684]
MTKQTGARAGRPRRRTAPAWVWEPQHETGGGTVRTWHTSCCGAYELASLGGQYFVLRPDGRGGYEETARGIHAHALAAYIELVTEHRRPHQRRGEPTEYDPLLDVPEPIAKQPDQPPIERQAG